MIQTRFNKILIAGLGSALLTLSASAIANKTEYKIDGKAGAKAGDINLPSVATSSTSAADFNRIMTITSQQYFSLRPLIATLDGIPDSKAGENISSRLGNYSPAGESVRRETVKAILATLKDIDRTTLSANQLNSLHANETLIKSAYRPATLVQYGSILGTNGAMFLPYAVNHMSGVHVEFPSIMADKFSVTNNSDATAYLTRLKLYPLVIDGVIETINHNKNLGVIPPDFIIDKTIKNLQSQIEAAPRFHPLVESYRGKLQAAKIKGHESLINTAITFIETGYYPATHKLIAALESIKPFASHHAGLSRLPNGKALYQAMITHMSDTTITAEEIHALGLSEVARITTEMDLLLQQIGYKTGTVGARMKQLLNDPKYIYPNTPEGKARALADIRSNLDGISVKLKDWFGQLPDQPAAIKRVPDNQAASTSGAFYDGPSLDGSRPGTFWISLYDTASIPSYSLPTLSYHEVNPGHHLQTIVALKGKPPILNTIFISNASGEGWALYAERLAAEMGSYSDDPAGNIGRLQAELHRAVRLVVDTGLHAMDWSREKSIEYSVATEGIHIDEATSEVERYAVWPGQALGYKLGELKIMSLREKAKLTLGDKFDIKSFHHQILEDGALPLNLLEEKINNWINHESK